MAKNRGIITTTQDAISDVARTGIEGARSIAGSAVGHRGRCCELGGQGRDRRGADRRPRRPAAGRPGQEAQDGEAPEQGKEGGQAEGRAKRRPAKTPAAEEEISRR